MMNKLRILRALLRKEIILMRHNSLMPRVIFLMPLATMLLMPLVATFDVKQVDLAVVDNDNSTLSHRLIADMSASEYLRIQSVGHSPSAAMQQMEQGTVDIILSIPSGFEVDGTPVDIAANGVNATKGTLGARYAAESLTKTLTEWRQQQGYTSTSNAPGVIHMFNPTENFRFYMIPALMSMLLIIICGFLPGLNMVIEKETGTIEAMNVTPVPRLIFVLSKLIPFWIAGLIVMAASMLIAATVYGLTPQGSIFTILLASVIFSLTVTAFGVITANYCSTMMQTIFVMYAFIMIFQLMGGLFTPISSMPQWAQVITYAIPPRYFINIMRAVYLRGAGLLDMAPDFLILTAIAAASCTIAAITYKKRN